MHRVIPRRRHMQWTSALTFVAILIFSIGESRAESPQSNSLPAAFTAVLSQIKAVSQIPILLPSEVPLGANHVQLEKATLREYAISLYYELGVGDAGFAASFSGQDMPAYNPAEVPNMRTVELARGTRGYFRAISCGGSCAPANIWWEAGGVLYQIQLRLSSSTNGQSQEAAMVAVANSAIQGGPR
jgi:hypothetical protein